MNVKRIIRRVTDNDYLFTIFTKILAVLIGLVVFYALTTILTFVAAGAL